ncbi:hypothetical protein KY285_016381 [Solanum tuberosum]|nr:hypothetical protein KY284_016374 [Solanum tuberosum]KAH0702103.1 hypothetical protein KY285_016381 [Solanum tuberosum]
MTDAEMMEEEKEKEMKVSGIREKMKEFDFMSYFYQTFNRTESPRWRFTLRAARSTPGFSLAPIYYCPESMLLMHPRKTEEGSHGLSITDSTHRVSWAASSKGRAED